MKLTQVGIKVDIDEWKKLPAGDRSRIIRDFIKMYLAQKDNKLEDIDEQILLRKKAVLEHQKVKVDTELNSINTTLDTIKLQREENIQKQLEAEKEALENAKRCINCKKVMEEAQKAHKFEKGLVCQECYNTSDNDTIRSWGLT